MFVFVLFAIFSAFAQPKERADDTAPEIRPFISVQVAMSITKVPLVATYRDLAESSTQEDAHRILEQVQHVRAESDEDNSAHNSALDTAFRELFVELIASLDINKEEFAPVWSLLDSVNLLCDNKLCEAALGFWLVEDLLDSQTIQGCRKVFNYLESRRERMTKINHDAKHLPILRCCNELLRRLSRAEDTVFCGRVFIYLFQSFPLGDKSSVNLRGEFHVENVTTYDEDDQEHGTVNGEMEVDATTKVINGSQNSVDENTDLNKLYPIFWSMQSLFSSPTRLFDKISMQQFKDGIKQTMTCFAQVAQNSTVSDPEKRGVKRKRGYANGENAERTGSAFNPKYLTNRDLFDLEIHDIEFRRHVLVQCLILLDFLLSLSAQGKAKLSTIKPNKSTLSALYDKYTFSEEDRVWAVETRKTIEKYLEEGNGTEGRYYLRMVNMVLSRDKNWTFWKAEGCPTIARDSVEATVEHDSQEALQKVASDANAPLYKPKGYDMLAFLASNEPVESLKEQKMAVPTLEQYYKGIETDDLDMDFATTEEEKREYEEKKAGKLWRALRSARGKRFVLCEEIKSGENLGALIGKVKEDPESAERQESTQDHDQAEPEAVATEMEVDAVKQES